MMRIVWFCVLLGSTACASHSAKLPKYYVLSAKPSSMAEAATNVIENGPSKAFIRTVTVPDYIDRSNIVLQLTENELYYSTGNLWAEPLPDGVARALSSNSNRLISVSSGVSAGLPQVDIVIDYFHIVDGHSVILSGGVTITSPSQEQQVIQLDYAFEEPLLESGYANGVRQMSVLVDKLAQLVSTAVAEL